MDECYDLFNFTSLVNVHVWVFMMRDFMLPKATDT